jgi:hypothetical protein
MSECCPALPAARRCRTNKESFVPGAARIQTQTIDTSLMWRSRDAGSAGKQFWSRKKGLDVRSVATAETLQRWSFIMKIGLRSYFNLICGHFRIGVGNLSKSRL